MSSNNQLKTQPNDANVQAFIDAVSDNQRRQDSLRLLELFATATQSAPRMWGSSIVGYGSYDYQYASGRAGSWMATGFAPRKQALTIYIMPGYQDYSEILGRLGPHKLGKSCLYIKRLSDIDETVLIELIQQGLKDLKALYPVTL